MARMCKFGESKTTQIMMATVPHVTSGLGLRKFQADGFLLTRVYTHRTNISEVSCLVNTQFYLQEISQIGGILLLTVNSLHQISWTLRTNKLDHRQVLFCSYVLTPFNMQILKFS